MPLPSDRSTPSWPPPSWGTAARDSGTAARDSGSLPADDAVSADEVLAAAHSISVRPGATPSWPGTDGAHAESATGADSAGEGAVRPTRSGSKPATPSWGGDVLEARLIHLDDDGPNAAAGPSAHGPGHTEPNTDEAPLDPAGEAPATSDDEPTDEPADVDDAPADDVVRTESDNSIDDRDEGAVADESSEGLASVSTGSGGTVNRPTPDASDEKDPDIPSQTEQVPRSAQSLIEGSPGASDTHALFRRPDQAPPSFVEGGSPPASLTPEPHDLTATVPHRSVAPTGDASHGVDSTEASTTEQPPDSADATAPTRPGRASRAIGGARFGRAVPSRATSRAQRLAKNPRRNLYLAAAVLVLALIVGAVAYGFSRSGTPIASLLPEGPLTLPLRAGDYQRDPATGTSASTHPVTGVATVSSTYSLGGVQQFVAIASRPQTSAEAALKELSATNINTLPGGACGRIYDSTRLACVTVKRSTAVMAVTLTDMPSQDLLQIAGQVADGVGT